jgi:hypothetical protein
MIYTLALFYALAVVVLLAANRRWSALRDLVPRRTCDSRMVALAVIASADALWPAVLPEIQDPGPPQFPVLRVAMVTAILVAATPFLARPLRRLGWIVVALVSAAAIVLAYGAPSRCHRGVGPGHVVRRGSAARVRIAAGVPGCRGRRSRSRRTQSDMRGPRRRP